MQAEAERSAGIRRRSRSLPPISSVKLGLNSLRGSVPDSMACISSMRTMDLGFNKLSRSIPEAVEALSKLGGLTLQSNKLQGSIPNAVQGMKSVGFAWLFENRLSGPIPEGLSGMAARLTSANFQHNLLRGQIPDVIASVQRLRRIDVSVNSFTGSIPHACGCLVGLDVNSNAIVGSALAWILEGSTVCDLDLRSYSASGNHLTGPLPEEMSRISDLHTLYLSSNQLRGTIPEFPPLLEGIDIGINQFVGSIPRCCPGKKFVSCNVQKNQLTGTLPPALLNARLEFLSCSGNRLEGSHLPGLQNQELRVLDLSGIAGSSSHLRGPLPLSLRRSSQLTELLAHHQMLEGEIPALTSSSLKALVLHGNRLRVLPDLRFAGPSRRRSPFSSPTILLHQNLLSCNPVDFGGSNASISLVALGNRFRRPSAGGFPNWIAPFERDGLLWVSDHDGSSLALKILAGGALFLGAALRVRQSLSWRVLSRWQAAGGCQGAIAEAVIRETSLIMKVAIWGVPFFVGFLWHWDVYSCPSSLALASACLRESSVIVNLIVVVFWTGLCLSSRLGSWLLSVKQPCEAGTPQQLWRRCILCCTWVPMILLLSALAVVDQVGKSVPGFFFTDGGAWASKAISMCIGVIQSIIISVILPCLAKKLIPGMRPLLGMSCLLVTCVVPALMIFYLDGACLAQWTSFWAQCLSEHAMQFNIAVRLGRDQNAPIAVVLTSGDICKPQRQEAHTSGCVQVALLRLQDMLLGKWITSGLVMPAMSMLFKCNARDPARLVQHVSLALEVALLTSGPLPLLTPVLVVGVLGKLLLAAMAWDKGVLRDMTGESIGAMSWIAAEILSALLCCAFCYGDCFASSLVALVALHITWKTLRVASE